MGTGAGARMRAGSVVLGLLGALVALSAAAYAFVIYMVEGTNGVANPYAPRVGFGLAAVALALLAGVGAALVYRRPPLGSLLLMGGSILGSVAIELFTIQTWYPLAVPLCLLSVVLAARGSARSSAGSLAMGALAAVLLLAAAVAGYFFAGLAVAAVCAVLFVVACWLLLARPTRIPAQAPAALLAALLVAGAAGLAGCGEASTPRATIPSVTFVARDFAFEAPQTLPGGLVSVTMDNQGKEPHQAQLARLHDGVTREQLVDALGKDPEAVLPLVSLVGGPNIVEPGKSQTVVVQLPAGEYVAVCFVASDDGHSHIEKGMTSFFTVGAPGEQPAEPEADALVTLRDFGIDVPAQVDAGHVTWKVWNHGGQAHELTLFKMVEGKTAQEGLAYLHEAESSGPMPFTSAGGMVGLDPDKSGWVQLDLDPGEYVAACFVPDPSSHAPHFMLGMTTSFVVR